LLGAQIDALVAGLLAALFVSVWLESIDNRLKAGSAVLFSSLLAGYGSPVLADLAAAHVAGMAGASSGLRMLGALSIGALAPALFPVAVRRLKQLVGEAKP
jgi:uncharacterized membrane protein